MKSTVDAAVVGGGPAGAATALRLARAGTRVALFEHSRYERLRMGETLPPSVNPLLRDLGVWDRFLALSPVPSYQTASAWGGDDLAARSFLFSPHGNGWHADRAAFDRMLADSAAVAGAAVYRGRRVRTVRRTSAGFEVDVPGGPVGAAVVVDATGRSARVARALGGQRVRLDRLVCASRVLTASAPTGDTVLEAVADGWWYFSPLPHGRRMIACFTDADTAARLGLGTPDGWTAALTRAGQVGSLATGVPGPVSVVSAASHHLRPCVGPGWLAVGDAALAVDPLSSGGVAFALRTAAAATDVLLGGDGDAYRDLVDEAAREYREVRTEIYGWENRFSTEPFWRARAATPT